MNSLKKDLKNYFQEKDINLSDQELSYLSNRLEKNIKRSAKQLSKIARRKLKQRKWYEFWK